VGSSLPYVLAGHYLTAGVGAVLGVLCAAFAASLRRERRQEVLLGMDATTNRSQRMRPPMTGQCSTQSRSTTTTRLISNEETTQATLRREEDPFSAAGIS